MMFLWDPKGEGQDRPSRFTVRVLGQEPIVLLPGESFHFRDQAHYEPFRRRMEDLVRSGEVELLGRQFSGTKPAVESRPAPQEDATAPGTNQPEEAPEGEAPAPQDFSDMTVGLLKARLDDRGVPYPRSAKKADLLALLMGSEG